MDSKNFNWDAAAFFQRLTKLNRFARENGYVFTRVASLDGFHGALNDMYEATAFVAVSDTSEGSLDIENTPHTSRVKTVFLAMRHEADDPIARDRAMDNMRELFRQFMSVLNLEKTRLEENSIFIRPRISFSEISRYFFTGCACAFFNIGVVNHTDISFNPDEWLNPEEIL